MVEHKQSNKNLQRTGFNQSFVNSGLPTLMLAWKELGLKKDIEEKS